MLLLIFLFTPQVYSLENVALLKPARQSSDYYTDTADKAVDGNTNGNYGDHSCSTVNQLNNSWWKVDLMGLYTISHVEIFNRVDGWDYRLQKFEIRVSWRDPLTFPSTEGNQCVYYPSIVPINGYTLACTQPLTGRYVSVFKAGDEHLTICEIRVFGEKVSTGVFEMAHDNFRFSGPIVTSLPAASSLHCAVLCHQSDNCSASSFQQVSSRDLVSGKSTCDLAAYIQFQDQPTVFSVSGWNLYFKIF